MRGVFHTYSFFDAAGLERMEKYSDDTQRLLDAESAEIEGMEDFDFQVYDEDSHDSLEKDYLIPRLVCEFSRQAHDGNGYHVGSETCKVIFPMFDARHMMPWNNVKAEDNKLHGIGIDLDLSTAEFELTPAREEILWEEIFRSNHPEHAQLLDEYKAGLHTPPWVGQDVEDSLDEDDFCQWLEEKHGIKVTREDYFDAYYPPDDDFWYQELEYRFEKLKEYLKTLVWKYDTNHAEHESEPWSLNETTIEL